MSGPAAEYLSELEHLGQAGRWAYDRIIALTIENTQLRQQLQEKDAKLQESQAALQRANEQLELWQRQACRQAAPFRRTEQDRNPIPARPGRKPGHVGAYRSTPDHIDQHVHVPLGDCPHCQGPLTDKRPVLQYIEELPVVRPHVTELITQEGWCPHCRKEVYSTHPLQTSR